MYREHFCRHSVHNDRHSYHHVLCAATGATNWRYIIVQWNSILRRVSLLTVSPRYGKLGRCAAMDTQMRRGDRTTFRRTRYSGTVRFSRFVRTNTHTIYSKRPETIAVVVWDVENALLEIKKLKSVSYYRTAAVRILMRFNERNGNLVSLLHGNCLRFRRS